MVKGHSPRNQNKKKIFTYTIIILLVVLTVGVFSFLSPSNKDNFEKNKIQPKYSPSSVDSIGRSIWIFLHTSLANEFISEKGIKHIVDFVISLPYTHPCGACADDFAKVLKMHKPPPEKRMIRQEVSFWVCNLHNEMNKRLGKKTFNCSLKSLDAAWKVTGVAYTPDESFEDKDGEKGKTIKEKKVVKKKGG